EHREERRVGLCVAASPAGGAERDEARVVQFELAGALEELGVLRVGAGIAAFDVVDTKGIQLLDDEELLLERERQPFHAKAVAEGSVVQEDVFRSGHRGFALPVDGSTAELGSPRWRTPGRTEPQGEWWIDVSAR